MTDRADDRKCPIAQNENEIDWEKACKGLRSRIARKLDRLDPDKIEDLVQEASVRLLRVVRQEGARNLEALMNVIAHGTSVDFLRRRRAWSLLLEPMTEVTMNRPTLGAANAAVMGDPLERVQFVVLQLFREHNAPCGDLARFYFNGLD